MNSETERGAGVLRALVMGAAMATAGALSMTPAAAQEDSVTVTAGQRYEASTLQEALLGSGYRDLWTAPIRVPVLRPDTAFGGLEPLQLGGGAQTVSLRLGADDGREFAFRSVDKDQSGGLHSDLHGTLIGWIVQDQISAKHPGAAMVVAELLEAAGVLHVWPELSVMVDDPMLGEFRPTFAGMLGMLEEWPNETAEVGDFAAYERVIGTDRLFERLRESSEDRPAPERYLRSRLMDLVVGDWDRHPDQYRWAQIDRDGRRYWDPIPRDRDNAFFLPGGLVAMVGGAIRPTITTFGPSLSSLYPMVHNAQSLDRLLLSETDRRVWTETALDLQQRLTDQVIREAVAEMPLEYQALNGNRLIAGLQGRRDALPGLAAEFYALLAESVDVHATDEAETATAERLPGGRLRLQLADEEGGVFFDRTFEPHETREVRIYLAGGDDEATVHGDGPADINLRIIGEEGDDRLRDGTDGDRVFLYDAAGANELVAGREGIVDRREFEAPETDTFVENNAPPARDWGATQTLFSPGAEWMSEVGPVLRAGPVWTRYGFRRLPHATRRSLTLAWAPLETRFGLEGELHQVLTGGEAETRVFGRVTQISLTRFYGFGDEIAGPTRKSDRHLWATELAGGFEVIRHLGGGLAATFGMVAEQVDPDPDPSFAPPLRLTPGFEEFGTGSLRAGLELDRRDSETYPRRGVYMDGRIEGFPVVWGDAEEPFSRSSGTARGYLPLPFPLETTLALRAGGARVWGDAPVQHAVFLGGGSTVRGYRNQRFAGDASVFSSAELRTRLAHVNLLVIRGEIGTLVHADAGRIWWRGDSADWLTGFGGGLWFAPLDRAIAGNVLYSYGDSHQLSAGIGVPF